MCYGDGLDQSLVYTIPCVYNPLCIQSLVYRLIGFYTVNNWELQESNNNMIMFIFFLFFLSFRFFSGNLCIFAQQAYCFKTPTFKINLLRTIVIVLTLLRLIYCLFLYNSKSIDHIGSSNIVTFPDNLFLLLQSENWSVRPIA